MKPMTPSGIRTRPTWSPLGLFHMPVTCAHRVRERRHLAEARGHLVDDPIGEGEPVDHGGGEAALAGKRHILCVFRLDLALLSFSRQP